MSRSEGLNRRSLLQFFAFAGATATTVDAAISEPRILLPEPPKLNVPVNGMEMDQLLKGAVISFNVNLLSIDRSEVKLECEGRIEGYRVSARNGRTYIDASIAGHSLNLDMKMDRSRWGLNFPDETYNPDRRGRF
jgi:hypothetical protein